MRLRLCKDRNQNPEISILKYLKTLNESSDQTWILKLMVLFWWSFLMMNKMKRKKFFLKKKHLLWQLGIKLRNFFLWSLLLSAMCMYWVESGWINAMTKKKLYFYYIRTLLESTSRNHKKCCFDEPARPLTSKRMYPGCSFGKNKMFLIHPVIAQKKYFLRNILVLFIQLQWNYVLRY